MASGRNQRQRSGWQKRIVSNKVSNRCQEPHGTVFHFPPVGHSIFLLLSFSLSLSPLSCLAFRPVSVPTVSGMAHPWGWFVARRLGVGSERKSEQGTGRRMGRVKETTPGPEELGLAFPSEGTPRHGDRASAWSSSLLLRAHVLTHRNLGPSQKTTVLPRMGCQLLCRPFLKN